MGKRGLKRRMAEEVKNSLIGEEKVGVDDEVV
jgi:hypothetical protein